MNSIDRRALKAIRQTLAELNPGDASHQAGIAPDPAVIFAPSSHANALDPERPLVIGNRGVGKSFWSAVLVHPETRLQISKIYGRLRLQTVEAVLGFYEDAGKDEGPAPSPVLLKQLLGVAEQPEDIWRAVLLKALAQKFDFQIPRSLRELVIWTTANVEQSEQFLRKADREIQSSGSIFLIVFDALDRLGRDWSTISHLSEGLLRFALEVRGFKAIRAKIFMRTDQANDDDLFRFADASKIRADAVKLVWQRTELFGLLYQQLLANKTASDALVEIGPSFGRLDVLA
ncbi:hypothetical protein V1286_006687 [Bradyrhizobium algeriense]|uniref:ATP-binding protein n=1 Tax=Bradyrhizobium algeriense TaxID=634784 RepID=A0ABU8BKT2_9BRAD